MEWNHGNYLRQVAPFVSRPDSSMGFLYNYDHYPAGLEMMKYPAVAAGQGSSSHTVLASGSMNKMMMMNGYAAGGNIGGHDHHQMMGDQKKKRLSGEQLESLESSFQEEVKLDPERKMRLARELDLQPRQVAIWFQNRRARWKAKQLEQLYDELKHQFEVVSSERKQLKHEFDVVSRENSCLKEEVSILKAQLKEAKSAAMKTHHQVVSTEISGGDTVESTSVGNPSSLMLTRQHHHRQNIDHQVNNNNHSSFHVAAEDYNPAAMVMPPQPPPSYWNHVVTSSYPDKF